MTTTKLSFLQELHLNVMYFQPQKSPVIRVVSYPSSSSSSSHKTISSGSVTEDFNVDSNSSTSSGKSPFSWASESSSSRGISFGSASATPKNQQHLVSKKSLPIAKSSKVGEKTSYMKSIALQNCRCQINHWSEKSNLYLVKQLEVALELILRRGLGGMVVPTALKMPQFVGFAHDLC